MKHLLKINLLFLLTIGLLIACTHTDSTIVYHTFHSLPKGEWAKGDTLTFEHKDSDSTSTTYRIYLELRNNSNYPYSNLQLLLQENYLDTTRFRTDTINVNLADSTGKWLGKGWGSLYQMEQFVKSVQPRYPATYKLKVTSGMRDENLKGINDIGIRIEQVK